MVIRSLLWIPALLVMTSSAQTLVPQEFFFEYRFFANLGGEENSTDVPLASMLSSLQDHLNDYAASLDDSAIAIDSIDYFSRGPCAAEDFELEYSHCGAYRSNVVMNIGSTYDPVMVKQILSRQIQTYVEDIHASENNNEVDSIYDYPKWVRSTVYIELVGVSTPMDDDEIFLFLQEFEKGFRPKMEADNYDWINVELLYQLNTTNDQIAFTSEERSHANKVKIMPKASCSGDACNDENFYNYLIVNLEQFTGEFLGRLKAIAPSDEAETYFDDILLIRVRNERLVIPELPLESDTNTTPANVWDDVEIPFWLWILAVLAFLVVVFAMVHVCILSPRQKAMASDKEKDEFDHQSNDEDEYQSRHGQTESPI